VSGTGRTATGEKVSVALPVGARVRHRRHPELTGLIKQHELHESGAFSPIPYCIAWDDSGRAADLLGWFFVYASDDTVERVPA
jgi:hypothetical protein